MYKIGQSGGFLGRMLGLLLNTGLSLMKNVLNSLAKSALIPLVLTAAAATDAAIQKKKCLDLVIHVWTCFGLSFAYGNINNF